MENKHFFIIVFFAFAIRFISLNQSLWLDEATTANVIQQFSFTEIISKFSPSDFHPPLYYLFMKLWSGIFGFSEIALRMPSIIFSLLTGWIVYLIGGTWTAAFFLFNPLVVYYSQEARMYMMVTFFLTSAFYFFIRLCHPEFISGSRSRQLADGMAKLRNLFFFSLFIILSFVTFYGSIFLIGAFFLYLIYAKKYKEFFLSSVIFFVALVVISPLLFQQFANSKIALNQVANWSLVLGKANLKNLMLIPVKFVIGRIDFYPKWLYYSVAGLWTGFVLYTVIQIKNKKTIWLFVYLVIFTLLLGFAVSFITPLLQYFRFIYLLPTISVLLAKSSQKKIILAGFLLFSLVYLLIPQFHREDWKSLAASIPQGKPVYMILSSSDPVKYYRKDLQIYDLRLIDERQPEIMIIPYTSEIHGVNYKRVLTEKKYRLVGKKTFRELELEDWRR